MKIFFMIVGTFLYSQNTSVQRPEPDKVMKTIESITLSEEQSSELLDDLNKNLKKFDSKEKKYKKKIKEKEDIEREIEELKNELTEINKNVTLIIKSHLSEEQLKQFDDIIKKQKEKLNSTKTDAVKKQEITDDSAKKVEENKDTDTVSPFNVYFP
ncbi:MAG: hypothetical protein KA059_06885 [Elusimicrobiales bacterium]|jgi:F0F1-type ATP synthase membrane subunit b/b'|nr:hypothetical protein [Elusimicrobiales bacterium]NLH39229.1 hypothetical protein [Elusimicrobiota bacterium]